MPQNEARAWWAEVEHVRESIERRRGAVVDSTVPADAARTRRFARAGSEPAGTAVEPGQPYTEREERGGERPVPRLDELDWPDLPGRRFEHSTGSRASERAVARARHRDAEANRSRARSHGANDDRRARSRAADDALPAAGAGAVAAAADDTRAHASATDVDFDRAFMSPPPPPGVRRTVQITGRTVAAPSLPRLVEVERRRPGRRPAERVGPRPDRLALYAVLLGFFLILVAATSAHAAI